MAAHHSEVSSMASPVTRGFPTSAVMTPANAVTVARILATPLLVLAVVQLGASWESVVAWIVLAGSDSVDGWLARRQGITTSGAFLDPLADKVLVLGALFALAAAGVVSWWPVALISCRELAISVFRVVLSRRGISVPARPLGKLKTATEALAVGLLLLPVTGRHHPVVGRDLLWVAVALAMGSAAQYLLDSRRRPPVAPAADDFAGA
jgi:CDP-diacylglycerol--glycerol-3-phosphate 3-phosphatidyltransferase